MQPIATWAGRRRFSPSVGMVLLPLRAFLGVTFVFAGLQKLADPNFLDANAPSGIHQQLLATAHRSPIGGILGSLAGHATITGVVIALAELAVGVGALAGLWTRLAAVGGVLVSVGFLLSVSWHTHPYYLGSDIVFAAAWVPIVIAGAPDRFSLDSRLERRTRAQMRLAPAGPVEIDFGVVRKLCGAYAKGHCRQLDGATCAAEVCPVLATESRLRPDTVNELGRRQFLGTARAVGTAAGVGAVVAVGTAVIGRSVHGDVRRASPLRLGNGPHINSASPPTTSAASAPAAAPTSSTSVAPRPPGTAIGAAASVPVGRAAEFTDPFTGQPAYVVQPASGQFTCFSAVCTHAGCTVGFDGSRFVCPCHGAEFDASTGAVLGGPTNQPLPAIPITVGPDGQLYITS